MAARRDRVESFHRAAGAAYSSMMRLDPYSRHKKMINDYVIAKGKKPPSAAHTYRTDNDILREKHRFLRTDDELSASDWEERMALKYYSRLFKEYCLADMTYYVESKIGLRWRTEREVFKGKGQFVCGNLACEERDGLESYEVNFSYKEAGERKNALVKLRCCPTCADKLNYKHNRRMEKRRRKEERRSKRKRRRGESQAPENDEDQRASEESGGESESPEEEKRAEGDVAAKVWKDQPELEKTRDEEFDEYLSSMFP
eukprot:CAMPEP_0175931640 /NCGR_PEP_ID=MMETSP0108-20121206/18959_1 /TAXON_ID=195067 ORGANISM="Goniomonas pacifica, Strain CCMP1869" /NCGR_SAMPLE_ID=MMETSP0108 /ASSEMBLY_ACC=CAM_ASM_000204 /LENGTH=257 /DNA_ID=CAMNT_0017255215 /DNA_START=10 /DNA_END=783 /DNA_ORIENTATION=-